MSQVAPVMHREAVQLDTRYIPKKLRAEVFLKSQGRCALCQVKIAQGQFDCDHIKRWADGGPTILGNLQALCRPCHREKTRLVDTPGAAKTKRMTAACKVREPDEKPVSRLRSNPKFPTRTDPWGKRPRKASQHLSDTREVTKAAGLGRPNQKAPS